MNINNLDYKQKTKLLLAGFGVALLLCYKLSFQNTISLISQYNEHNVPEGELQEKLNSYDQLNARNNRLNQLITVSGNNKNYEQQILQSITGYCTKYKVELKNYTPFNSYVYENMNVSTQMFTIEGGFNHMLRCINDLENGSIPLKIAAISFKTSSTFSNDTPHLTANLYLQQLSINECGHEH